MTRQDLIDLCLTFPSVYEDYPYDKITASNPVTVMRHRGNKKIFVSIYMRQGRLCTFMKCDPMEVDFLSGMYQDAEPGHKHWMYVYPGGDSPDSHISDVPAAELRRMIENSYDLTKAKADRKR